MATTTVADFVESCIKEHKIVIFSKSFCPYCKKAKSVFSTFGLSPDDYSVIEIDGRDDCDEIQTYMLKKTGAKSVPRVFIAGEFIGGGDDCVRLFESGELEKKVRAAGAHIGAANASKQ